MPSTNLEQTDSVELFPSLAQLDADGRHWKIDVHGDVFSRGKVGLGKRILLKFLQRAMRVSNDALQTEVFQQRIDRFLASDQRGKRVAVGIGDDTFVMPKKSQGNGHFFGSFQLPVEEVQQFSHPDAYDQAWLPVNVRTAEGDQRSIVGQVQLLQPTGTSIISDIDDTLKDSNVACKRTLLNNTFLNEYQAVPGMAGLFQNWAQQGAAFHYVSSSPWQLYRQLAAHFAAEKLPPGSFHLKAFRLRDHLIRRILMLRRSGKATIIRSLIKQYPGRKFVLVGDSGEADPEIYASMARKFPGQILKIMIRHVPGEKDPSRRLAKTAKHLPPHLWQVYRDAQELSAALPTELG